MIKNVLYVPSIAENLLSVKRLAIKGLIVQFDDSKYVIASERKEIAYTEPSIGMYRLQLKEAVMSVKSRHVTMSAH